MFNSFNITEHNMKIYCKFTLILIILILGSTFTQSAKKPNNCSLVKATEVGEVIGKKMTLGGDSILGCAYIPEGKKISYFTVLVTEKKDTPESIFNNSRPSIKIEKLKGIGDAAAMAIEDGTILDVVIFSGKWSVRFGVTFADIETKTKKFEAFKALMKKAITRL